MFDSSTRLLSGRRSDSRGGVADHAPLVVEGPFVGMAELLVDPFGAAEDLGDLLRPGREKKMHVASTMVARA